ncbi:MAG TPA: hypothetical protein O0X27_03115 [Methanocorpusculum sp.]|nr:hypothetical protein [Methanocorpusculum sp.]
MDSKTKVLTAVVLGCALVLAFTACAGCTETTDTIVGTYGLDAAQILKELNDTAHVPSDYEKKFMILGINPENWLKVFNIKLTINNGGTGKAVTTYSSSSIPDSEEQLTWKKIGDNTYSLVWGESTETVTLNPVKGTFTALGMPFMKQASDASGSLNWDLTYVGYGLPA